MPIELAWWMVPAFETLLLLTAVMLIVNWISGDDFIDTTVGQIIAYILACWLVIQAIFIVAWLLANAMILIWRY